MATSIAALPILAFAVGFFGVSLLLLGKGEAKATLWGAFFVGVVAFIVAFMQYFGLGIAAPDYLSATINGVAGMVFMIVGSQLWGADGKAVGYVVLWNGLFLLIAGLYVLTLGAQYIGIAVVIFGLLCWIGNLPTFTGMNAKGVGYLHLLLVAITSIIGWGLMIGYFPA